MKDDDNKLAKWIEDGMNHSQPDSHEEKLLQDDVQRIVESVDGYVPPKVDADVMLQNINNRIGIQRPMPKIFSLRKALITVAALAVLTFSVISLMNDQISVATDFQQHLTHTLPDDSQIILNSNSHIQYEDDFASSRILTLEGEAFFSVEKGQKFTVHTSQGDISVLGTSFNIYTRNDVLRVSCKTGKVRVTSGTTSNELRPGDRIRIVNGTSGTIDRVDVQYMDSWTSGSSRFESVPFADVVTALSSYYQLDIDLPSDYKSKTFTGGFVQDDLEKALKMVFLPMGLNYTSNGNRINIEE